MSIENIIQAWKASEDHEEDASSTNPVGEELSDQELQEATGMGSCAETCSFTCFITKISIM